jgi:predicted nucleic acid-binding protein
MRQSDKSTSTVKEAAFRGRYQNLKPDLADAALAYLAEREDITTVFTLDRRDFATYRRQDGRAFDLLPP